jgi:hypothetical protein
VDRLTGKPGKRPAWELKDRLEIARRLHAELYQALWQHDRPKLREIACAGLLAQSTMRIDDWKRRELPPAKFDISYRGFLVPNWVPGFLLPFIPNRSIKAAADTMISTPFGGKDATVRQVVVRIRSRQSYQKIPKDGPVVKDHDEYVVIQKMIGDGLPKEWMIWGTIKPSDKKHIDRLLALSGMETSFSNIARNAMTNWGGGGNSAMM